MKTTRVLILAVVSSVVWLAVSVPTALAQTPVDPSATPLKNESATAPITPFGIRISFAALLLLLGLAMVLFLTIMYMRYAPRFSKDEESMKVVRADRVVVGQELPRRNVDLSQAAPVVVGPPAVPTALVAAAAAPPAAIASAPDATPPPAAAAPEPADAVPAPQAAPAPASVPAAPPAAPAERVEVTMDQVVFDTTLQELLDAGTDRRIAEGKARRAGMIAAKKAAGEA
ncbi:MAG TPA: hypothetical protein VI341_02195 [Actinomycetota bacterium]